MRLKSELYEKEQNEMRDKIIKIMDVGNLYQIIMKLIELGIK